MKIVIRLAIIAIMVAVVLAMIQNGNDQLTATTSAIVDVVVLALRLCLASWLLLGGAALLYVFRRQHLEAQRQRDGAWAMRRVYLIPTWRRVAAWLRGEISPYVEYDPNLNVGGAIVVTGHGIAYPEPAGGWERAMVAFALVEQTNRMRAVVPGDGVRALPWASTDAGAVNAPLARLVAGAYDKAPQLPGPVAEEAPPAVTVVPTLRELLSTSGRDDIAFGYSQETPEFATWRPDQQAHLRIHGRTGGGKTSAALTLAAGALAHGWRVLVLAPRGLKDWRALHQHGAEVVDVTRPGDFVDALRVVDGEFQRREALLAEHDANDLTGVPFAVRPPRLVVVAEEYGMQRVNASTAERDEMDRILASLAAQSRADGIHLIAIDQVPAEYERRVKANLVGIVFRLPQGPGMAADYPRAHALAPYQFHFDGDRWLSVNAAPQLATALAGGGVRHDPLFVRERSRGVRPEVDPTQAERTNAPQTAEGWHEWMVDWIAGGHLGLLQEPAQGVMDAARAMAALAGRPEDADSFKGLASDLAKRIRREARVNGAPLGTDTTQEG